MTQHKTAPIICIMGPTASGKTDLALALAKRFPIEIINVDSAQIYQEMDIGTGKPDSVIREKIPHHLMDFLDPKVPYSAAQFRQDACACIDDIHARHKVPVLVGGTMLYFKILQEGIAKLPDRNNEIRAQIEEMAQQHGWEAMHQRLAQSDPQSAHRIKPTDSQRIQRALEIIEITGLPMSYWLNQPKEESMYQFINVGLIPLTTERSVLHQKIEQRFDMMLAQGLVTEVQRLKERGDLDCTMPSIRAVGYRQVWEYLLGTVTFEEMRLKAIFATRQLAKRQLTWLRRWPELIAHDFMAPSIFSQLEEIIAKRVFVYQPAALA